MIVAIIQNASDNNPKNYEITWENLCKRFQKPDIRAEKDGLAILGGEYDGNGREEVNLVNRCLFCVDIDDGFLNFDQIVKGLDKMGLESFVYTTYSHDPDVCEKFRVLLPFDKPLVEDIPETLDRMVDLLEGQFGRHIDKVSRKANQLFYISSCPEERKHLFRWALIPGLLLPIDDFKAPQAPEEKLVKARESSGDRPGDQYSERGSWDDLLTKHGWHQFTTGKDAKFYTRPGKETGISGAVYKDKNIFYIFSSSPEVAPLNGGEAYSLFTAYTLLEHNGDFDRAAAQLASEGYGKQDERDGKIHFSVAGEIRSWVASQPGVFDIRTLYSELELKGKTKQEMARTVLLRMVKEGSVVADGNYRGRYRRAEKNLEKLNWREVTDNSFNIFLPLGLNKLVRILPRSVIVVSGSSNAGKTGLLLNIAADNMKDQKIYYFCSEGGAEELRARIKMFDRPLNDWDNLEAYDRHDNFADVIVPNGLNIIDFLEVNSEYWRVDQMLTEISHKLTTGVCVIALQKNRNQELGVGSDKGLWKPRLYLSMDYNRITIQKAKTWVDPAKNPNGLVLDFDLTPAGCRFKIINDWHDKSGDYFGKEKRAKSDGPF